ncbi:hypothetical protein C8A05DRAFT_38986, partial [Staphylotrichum tortipilum]
MESKKQALNPAEDDTAEPAMKRSCSSAGDAHGSSKPSPVQDNATQVLDRRGDLLLVAGEGDAAVRFRVCSRAMARSSSFWETLLFEDDPEVLTILLRGIHGDLVSIPKTLSCDQLLRLVVFCDKYDTVGTLRTFWELWVKQADPGPLELKTFVSQLWIAHTLGYYHYFAGVLVAFLSHLRQGKHDTLVFGGESGDEVLNDDYHLAAVGLEPDQKVRGRYKLFIEAVDGPSHAMDSLTAIAGDWDPCCRSQDAKTTARKLCDRAMLGTVHCALRSSNLCSRVLCNGDDSWLATRPENLDDFLVLLETVRTDAIAEAGTACWKDHAHCAPWDSVRRKDVLRRLLNSVMNVVYANKDRFKQQQRKSG